MPNGWSENNSLLQTVPCLTVTEPKAEEEEESRDAEQEDAESKHLQETAALLMQQQQQSQGSTSQLAPSGHPTPGIRKLSMAASSISEGKAAARMCFHFVCYNATILYRLVIAVVYYAFMFVFLIRCFAFDKKSFYAHNAPFFEYYTMNFRKRARSSELRS